MGDQSRGAMPGERPPGNRKPGQNRGPRNGAGPSSSHSGGATSFTAKQKEDISTIRAFGIEEDKLTDEQIVSHMQSTKCRTEQLIDEFYTKGALAEEFHTVASKQEKKAAQRKTKADRPERPERERRDDNRADRGERRAEPRPKQTERRETKPQPRPAQPVQHQASKAAVQNKHTWGNQPASVSQVTQALSESWPAQEPAASAEPIAAPEPAAPAPAPAPAPKAGGGAMSWAQRAAPKVQPKPAPVIALPAQPKHVSPPPSPQLESAAAAMSAVEEVFEPPVEAPSNSTEAEVAPVADAAPVEPVSIGKPAATYAPAPAAGSVWGVTTPAAAAQAAKDLSTTAPAFEPAEQEQPTQSMYPAPGVYPAPAQPAPEISGSNSYGAGPSSAAPFVGQPQASSFGASTSYAIGSQGGSHGSGYMQSLGVEAPREQPAGMGISFGSWGALGATENEPSTSGNGVSSYGAEQAAVEIPPAAPAVRSPPKPKESADYPSSSNDAAQMAQNQFMAGFGGQPPYAAFQSDDSAQQQYGEQQEQLQYGGAQSYGDDDAAQRYGNGAKKGGAQQQATQPQQAKQPVPQQPQQNMQQQQMPQYYGQGMQQFPQGQAMYPQYPQPFYGYQFPPGQAGQYQYPAQQQQQNMNQMKRGQYSVPPQGGFPQQAQGSQQYPYAQQGAGAFDYSQTYSDPAAFAGQAGEAAAPAATDKAGQEAPNQQAVYQQFSHAGHAGYPAANNFYYPQHMQQPTPQQYGQHMPQQQQQQQYWHQQQQQQQNGAQ